MSNRTMLDHRQPMLVLVRRNRNDLIFNGPCPYCGRRHRHGAGGDKGPWYGHRVTHCVRPFENSDAEYYLIEALAT